MHLSDYKSSLSTQVVVTRPLASYKFVHVFYAVFCICGGYFTISIV